MTRRDPLLGSICHDLRAPLAAVTMGTNFVLQTTEDDEAHGRQRRILEAMLRSCSQMERLVRTFADLSEIEARSLTLRVSEHDAREMLEIAAAGAGDAAKGRGVTIVVRESSPVRIVCDRDRMLRAIGHMVESALAAAPRGSEVAVAVEADDDGVAFRVIDHGPGFAPAMKKNLFDRDWHAKNTGHPGAGFGLAIARGFARAHGGDVAVESRPGENILTIRVPRDAEEPRARTSSMRRRATAGDKSRVSAARPRASAKAPRRRSP